MKKPKFATPEPMKLATLAAILYPKAEPEVAMKRAMAFYIEASLFVSELPKSFDAVMAYASEKRKHEHYIISPLRVNLEKARADTLELDPEKDDDPARQYLAAQGLRHFKKARSVLDKFRRFYNFLPAGEDGQSRIKAWERVKDGRTVYDIPRHELDIIANQTKSRRAEDKKRSRRSRRAEKSRAQKTDKEKNSKSYVPHAR